MTDQHLRTPEQRKNWYLSHFEQFEKSLNGEATTRVHEIRRAAISKFAEVGFPTTREEDWRFTDVAPLAATPFASSGVPKANAVSSAQLEPFTFGNLAGNLLVCVNGHYAEQLSRHSTLPKGIRIAGLSEAMNSDKKLIEDYIARYATYEENGFVALSTAFLRDGVFISVPKNTILEEPIHILFVSTGSETAFVTYPRVLILAGEASQFSVIESHVGLGNNTYFSNAVAEIVVGQNAVVEYDRFQNESGHAFHIGTTHVHQERSSTFSSNAITLGGALTRNNITAVLDGEGCECTLDGLYLATGEQVIDNHTTINHVRPNCNSHELYKGILGGKSKGVFNGKIFVKKDAQKTDAKQTNKNLILSDDATIDTKPQLEIFANDVKCTHGATIGQLDEEQLFYLRARGIDLDTARDMLIYAFASDVINRIKVEPLRDRLHELLHSRLEQARVAKEL